ncbi:MAG: hypothetical protein JO254_04520 [Pseudolabrys sp.]|nr:hypothetical protein [Pseudolabrys sp.]
MNDRLPHALLQLLRHQRPELAVARDVADALSRAAAAARAAGAPELQEIAQRAARLGVALLNLDLRLPLLLGLFWRERCCG